VQSSRCGIFHIDSQGDCIYVNNRWSDITGITWKDALGKGWLTTVHPDDRRYIFEEWCRGMKENRSNKLKYRIHRPDCAETWVYSQAMPEIDETGKITSYVGTITDITDFERFIEEKRLIERQANEILREKEERYRNLFEDSKDAIYISTREGKFIDVNQAMLDLLGYTKEEMIRLDVERLYANPADRLKFQQGIEKLGSLKDYELKLLKKDGTEMDCLLTATLCRLNDGAILGYQGIIRDISRNKENEKKISDYQAQLRSLASQLSYAEERERRRIATDLHDHISQNLALAKLKLEALQELISGDFTEYVDVIHELLEKAIQYARSLTFELSPPVLYELGFEAAVGWLSEQFQRQHGILVDFYDDRQPKPMNEEIRIFLFKTVRELLTNVIKHAHASKTGISIKREGDNVQIMVEDDGIGFDTPEKKSTKINTFGLFNIREQLQHLGGHFNVKSESGHGTRITLIVPIKDRG
ncbi:MAG: PAS domain S-box protein, partial [Nitrospirota bacterium]